MDAVTDPETGISIHAPREGGDVFFALCRPSRTSNFNPRPPRGGATHPLLPSCPAHTISIHAPREGGDTQWVAGVIPPAQISIHAPREGGDHAVGLYKQVNVQFQSTPPARGATLQHFTIHNGGQFQSTPPARGATLSVNHPAFIHCISIHAPREGGDHACVDDVFTKRWNFNPRPPRGGRPLTCA